MKYRLNKLPVKTTNSFKINDLEVDIEIPFVFETLENSFNLLEEREPTPPIEPERKARMFPNECNFSGMAGFTTRAAFSIIQSELVRRPDDEGGFFENGVYEKPGRNRHRSSPPLLALCGWAAADSL